MLYRTVICVWLVGIVGAAQACTQPVDEPTPPVQEVRAPEVETQDVVAMLSKQDQAPPADQTAEPSKVEEFEPAESTQPDEPELVTTTFPPLGMQFSVPPYRRPGNDGAANCRCGHNCHCQLGEFDDGRRNSYTRRTDRICRRTEVHVHRRGTHQVPCR